jgi:hypothetical protein
MQQMTVPEEVTVKINPDDKSLPEAVRTLQPLVFKDRDAFCCVLGPNTEEGVFGCGDSAKAALEDWEANMRKRIIYHKKDDEVAGFIIDKLNASIKK